MFIKVKTFCSSHNGITLTTKDELINLDTVSSFRRGTILREGNEREVVYCDTVRMAGIAIDCTFEEITKLVVDRITGSL